jgi:Tol biopolymer transport system component
VRAARARRGAAPQPRAARRGEDVPARSVAFAGGAAGTSPPRPRSAAPERRRARAGLLAVTVLAFLAALGPATPAGAHWGPGAELVSVDWPRLEQADGASTAVDVSADGRYVVFQTRATNFFADGDPDPPDRIRQGGIFRYDRTSGALALVADGDQLDEQTGDLVLRGATSPSVSDDGRFVVFSTAQKLVPQDANNNADVYVRDMNVPLTSDRAASGAYALVSARDGGDDPAHYAPRDPPLPTGDPGATVFPGQAISGDGRYVAFRTPELSSDLPDGPTTDTPAQNVFVRDLVAKRTVLVSKTLDGSGPAGSALAPVVLSRDGSTVAWVGTNASIQTRMIAGEVTDPTIRRYYWKRWNDPSAVTRRVTGLADPDDPACPPDGVVTSSLTATGPCYGPLAQIEQGSTDISSFAPALSADGFTVAFIAGAPPRPAPAGDTALDAYETSMAPGVSRKAGTRVITIGTVLANPRANSDVDAISMSSDGSRLLLTTTRSQFLPPTPPLIGTPRSNPGGDELYLVDLARSETRRILSSPAGGDVDGGVDLNAQLSPDGHVAAFTSAATNLLVGDANDVGDAFAVSETPDPATAPPPSGGQGAPVNVVLDGGGGGAGFAARAISQRDGSLLLRVSVPVPGVVAAVATTVPVATKAKKGKRPAKPKPRRVASAKVRVKKAGLLRFSLQLSGRDLGAVRGGKRLRVRIALTLTPAKRGRARRTSTTGTFIRKGA